ncbi:MAG: ROK family protein [Bacteroidetes bacterium]|nr:ROK family protein [Bacteroidota bacterium]
MANSATIIRKEIIKLLYFNKVLSISALSSSLNKSVPVILKIINELVEDEVIIETGFAPSTGGRRAVMYALETRLQYILCVSMDQFVTNIALLDLENNVVGEIDKLHLPLATTENALQILIDGIVKFINKTDVQKEKIIAIGIGMPGFIDVKKGINYSFLQANANINDLISEATGKPVFIDNDSSIIALAELKFGGARNKKEAMVVNIGWGVGLGIILNSKLYRGQNGFAGEFSHIPLFSNNKLCSCGKMGCLETETSLLVIIEKARKGIQEGRISILKNKVFDVDLERAFEQIVLAAKSGDQFALELISKAAFEIGRGVSILIHILNPEIIVLSGRGATVGNLWMAALQQAVAEYSIPRLAAYTELAISPLGQKAGLIGAAVLVMENLEKLNFKKAKSEIVAE